MPGGNATKSTLLDSQIVSFLEAYRNDPKNHKKSTNSSWNQNNSNQFSFVDSSSGFGAADPTTANALNTSTVVLRKKKDSSLKNSPFDGVRLSNYRFRLQDVQPEVFDWVSHFLWLKNCPLELATVIATHIANRMSTETLKKMENITAAAASMDSSPLPPSLASPSESLIGGAIVAGSPVDMPDDSLAWPSNGADSTPRSSLPSALCSLDIARQSREMVDEYIDQLGNDPVQTVEMVHEYVSSPNPACTTPTGPPGFASSICAVKNGRKTMEDRHVIIHDLNKALELQSSNQYSYYAIFDGHAGVDAASYSTAHLHHNLVSTTAFADGRIEDAFAEAFEITDTMYIKRCKEDGVDQLKPAGTTALCALIENNKTVYLAWVGDSQAVLVRNGCHEEIMLPHKPDMESERIRIQELGGLVVFVDTWRVNGILSVTRAIGDPDHKPFVIAQPSFSKFEIDSSLDFLVLGCDGLFDQLTSQDIASYVFEFLCKHENRDAQEVIHDVSLYLSQMAIREGSSDNITSIVLFFKPFEQLLATGFPSDMIGECSADAFQQPLQSHMLHLQSECSPPMTTGVEQPQPAAPSASLSTTNGGHFPYTDFSELPLGANFKLNSMQEAVQDNISAMQSGGMDEVDDGSQIAGLPNMALNEKVNGGSTDECTNLFADEKMNLACENAANDHDDDDDDANDNDLDDARHSPCSESPMIEEQQTGWSHHHFIDPPCIDFNQENVNNETIMSSPDFAESQLEQQEIKEEPQPQEQQEQPQFATNDISEESIIATEPVFEGDKPATTNQENMETNCNPFAAMEQMNGKLDDHQQHQDEHPAAFDYRSGSPPADEAANQSNNNVTEIMLKPIEDYKMSEGFEQFKNPFDDFTPQMSETVTDLATPEFPPQFEPLEQIVENIVEKSSNSVAEAVSSSVGDNEPTFSHTDYSIRPNGEDENDSAGDVIQQTSDSGYTNSVNEFSTSFPSDSKIENNFCSTPGLPAAIENVNESETGFVSQNSDDTILLQPLEQHDVSMNYNQENPQTLSTFDVMSHLEEKVTEVTEPAEQSYRQWETSLQDNSLLIDETPAISSKDDLAAVVVASDIEKPPTEQLIATDQPMISESNHECPIENVFIGEESAAMISEPIAEPINFEPNSNETVNDLPEVKNFAEHETKNVLATLDGMTDTSFYSQPIDDTANAFNDTFAASNLPIEGNDLISIDPNQQKLTDILQEESNLISVNDLACNEPVPTVFQTEDYSKLSAEPIPVEQTLPSSDTSNANFSAESTEMVKNEVAEIAPSAPQFEPEISVPKSETINDTFAIEEPVSDTQNVEPKLIETGSEPSVAAEAALGAAAAATAAAVAAVTASSLSKPKEIASEAAKSEKQPSTAKSASKLPATKATGKVLAASKSTTTTSALSKTTTASKLATSSTLPKLGVGGKPVGSSAKTTAAPKTTTTSSRIAASKATPKPSASSSTTSKPSASAAGASRMAATSSTLPKTRASLPRTNGSIATRVPSAQKSTATSTTKPATTAARSASALMPKTASSTVKSSTTTAPRAASTRLGAAASSRLTATSATTAPRKPAESAKPSAIGLRKPLTSTASSKTSTAASRATPATSASSRLGITAKTSTASSAAAPSRSRPPVASSTTSARMTSSLRQVSTSKPIAKANQSASSAHHRSSTGASGKPVNGTSTTSANNGIKAVPKKPINKTSNETVGKVASTEQSSLPPNGALSKPSPYTTKRPIGVENSLKKELEDAVLNGLNNMNCLNGSSSITMATTPSAGISTTNGDDIANGHGINGHSMLQ